MARSYPPSVARAGAVGAGHARDIPSDRSHAPAWERKRDAPASPNERNTGLARGGSAKREYVDLPEHWRFVQHVQ
jgi:hypothetical protein